MVTTPKHLTLEDVERGNGPDGLWEVSEGVLIEMPPAGGRHTRIWGGIYAQLWHHVVPQGLGYVYGADAGFVLARDPLVMRVPDVAFIRTERLPADFDDGGMLHVAPDLVVEVLSPNDRSDAVFAKIATWLDGGVEMLWLIDPDTETATVIRPGMPPRFLSGDQILDANPVIPGFSLRLSTVFAR